MQCEDNYPHILLVDDDELLRDSFALFFHDNGWSCDVCEDGKAGLKAAISGNYDVVITDLMMPNLSGLDLLRELHKVKPSQAVMVVTGVATMDDAISALRMGAVDFLQKPVELSFLESAIKRVVPGMQSERLNLRLGQHVHRCAAEYELVSRELVGKSVDIPLIEDLNAAGVITVNTRLQLQLVVQEAITNSLEHGNFELQSNLKDEFDENGIDRFQSLLKGRAAQEPYASRKIYLSVEYEHGELTMSVRDEGPGFDAPNASEELDIESAILGSGLEASYGRGLTLIRASMDSVEFAEDGRKIIMRKRL